MTPKEFADRITGREYLKELTSEEIKDAHEAGLVIVYGYSDDVMVFDGAISEECGAWNGCTALVDAKGVIPDFDNIEKEGRKAKDVLRDYFAREPYCKPIEAIWNRDGISWQYETEIPHETFEIIDDGEVYCRGIVFSLKDI